jgi:DNA-binding NarL/FixJ family response regulator
VSASLPLRERRVLAVLAAGATHAEAAQRLGLHEVTVRKYVTAAYDRLGVRNRSEAYLALGWLRPPDVSA